MIQPLLLGQHRLLPNIRKFIRYVKTQILVNQYFVKNKNRQTCRRAVYSQCKVVLKSVPPHLFESQSFVII